MSSTDIAVSNAMRALRSGSPGQLDRVPRMSGLGELYATKYPYTSVIDLNTTLFDPVPSGAKRKVDQLRASTVSKEVYQWENWMRWGLVGYIEKMTGRKMDYAALGQLAQNKGTYREGMILFQDGRP